MASTLKTFDSLGGFSVENTSVIDQDKNFTNVNSLEIKNQNFTDSYTSTYILRRNTTDVLAQDSTGTQITISSSSVNFVTGHIVGVNNLGTGYLSQKIESVLVVDATGNVTEISNLITVIKDSVPSGETWAVELFDTGANNRFSYSVQKQGGVPGQTIKWVASVQVTSIDWT